MLEEIGFHVLSFYTQVTFIVYSPTSVQLWKSLKSVYMSLANYFHSIIHNNYINFICIIRGLILAHLPWITKFSYLWQEIEAFWWNIINFLSFTNIQTHGQLYYHVSYPLFLGKRYIFAFFHLGRKGSLDVESVTSLITRILISLNSGIIFLFRWGQCPPGGFQTWLQILKRF